MSRNLDDLNKSFGDKCKLLLHRCEHDGAIMRPFWTIRDPYTQAKFYRQSRCWEEIKTDIEMLNNEGAYWIAEILKSVGPQYGKWLTNALPGGSIHQYAFAMDCYSLEPGLHSRYVVNWNKMNPYKIYATHAKDLGLNAGLYWSIKDAVHVQSRDFILPETWQERNQIMLEKFGK
jgi:hypothetical protein